MKTQGKTYMKIILIFIVLSLSLFAKNILILNSYSSMFQWTMDQSHTINNELKKQKNLHIYTEYMDTKRFKPNQRNQDNLFSYYKNKYKDTAFDIVITTDDNAFNFAKTYKKELFSNAKFFFSGVNNIKLKQQLDKDLYAGVFEEKNPIKNLKLAQNFIPFLKTVYLITDNSVTAKKQIYHYKQSLKEYKNIEFIYIDEKDIENTLKKLQNYKQNSVMMLLVFGGFYKNNKHLDYSHAVQDISKIYKEPMIIHTNTFIDIPNTNIIGGDCTDGKASGEMVASHVLRYLHGTPIRNIGFSSKKGNKVYLNVHNLNKFGFKTSDCKAYNPILINQKISFYSLYSTWINIMIFIAVILLVFIIVLTRKNNKIQVLNSSLEIKIQSALSKLKEQHLKHEQDSIKNTKFSTIGQMAAGITHEINTPLTYIKGTVEMSRYDIEDLPKSNTKNLLLEDNLKVMNGLNRIGIIVESMREMSQVTPTIREKTNLYATLITVLRMTHNRANQITKIYVNNDLFKLENSNKEKYIFEAVIHKQRIEQVWTIILNNALDELIKIDDFNKRRIDINISKNNDNIIIEFLDNAGGICPKIIDKIFEPFVSTKESSGIGIGLNVAKKIVLDHNGTICVNNKEQGASFIIKLS